MTEGLPADPRDDDEVEPAPDEHDESTEEEGTGPDVKTDPVDEPEPAEEATEEK